MTKETRVDHVGGDASAACDIGSQLSRELRQKLIGPGQRVLRSKQGRSRPHRTYCMIKLAEACERIAGTTKKLEKTAIVAEYLKSRTLEEASVSAIFLSGRPFPVWEETTLQVGGTSAVADRRRTLRQDRSRTHRSLPPARRSGRSGGSGSASIAAPQAAWGRAPPPVQAGQSPAVPA